MDAFLHDIAHTLFSKGTLALVLLFAVRLVVLTALEKRHPAQFVSYPRGAAEGHPRHIGLQFRRVAGGGVSRQLDHV